MKYCTHCGNQLVDEAVVCPKCGCAAAGTVENTQTADDIPSGGLNILSFLFPIVGLVCFCAMYSTKPNTAKAAGKAGLIGFIIAFSLIMICEIIAVFL